MKQLRVYVDTSVIGGCFDEEFALASQALMQMARDGRIVLVVSDLLLVELASAPAQVIDFFKSLPEESVELMTTNLEADALHEAYLDAQIVGPASGNDAQHVANATVARVDVIVSWNFRHIVHLDKIRLYNAVNLREGYNLLEIRSPREVV